MAYGCTTKNGDWKWFKDYELKRIFKKSDFNPILSFATHFDLNNKNFTDYHEILSYFDMKWYIGKHQTYRADQFLMRFSLEGRFPFLDHELIEAMAVIPTRLKINDGIMKYILKKMAENYMPAHTVYRPKKGFNTPINSLMDNCLKDYSIEKIRSLKERDIFENSEIDKLLLNFNGNKMKLWQLTMTELWYRAFIDNSGI